MEYYGLARVIHIVAVVIWIGGLAFVTSVLLPSIRKFKSSEDQISFFELVENRFSIQAKITTILTMLSGVFMLWVTDGWLRYQDSSNWWLWAMTFIWVIFTIVLFILEPLILRKWFSEKAKENPERIFKLIQRFHWVLLTLSLLTIAGSVAGSHGWYWI